MNVVMIVMPFVLFLILFVPWLALLAVPVATCVVSGALIVGALGRWSAPAQAIEALGQGLLALVGLDRDPGLEELMRGAIGRALGLAPAGTRAGACACVKPSGGSFVGVLRIWNSRGEWMLRTPGESVTAVANAIVERLHDFGDRFPAREGAVRVRVHECDPRTCPLRQLRTMARAQALTA